MKWYIEGSRADKMELGMTIKVCGVRPIANKYLDCPSLILTAEDGTDFFAPNSFSRFVANNCVNYEDIVGTTFECKARSVAGRISLYLEDTNG